jgi:hypothetical protein
MNDRGPSKRPIAITAVVVVVAIAALIAGRELSAFRGQATPGPGAALAPTASATATARVTLPQPTPQPITRTSAAAQVAWIQTFGTSTATVTYVGMDPSGRIAGRIVVTDADPGRAFRSADGASIAIIGADRITMYSALDGSKLRTYPRQLTGSVIDAAFSSDGNWLALILGTQGSIQVVDLRSGSAQTTPLGSDPRAATPGLTTTLPGPLWSTLVFAPDSSRLYTIVDWGGPMSLTAFDLTPTGLVQIARTVDGQSGKKLSSCAGPGLAARVLPDGKTLVAFCHMDGDVWFVDLPTLTVTDDLRSAQTNPFELSPIFTPDGQILYLRSGRIMQAVDVRSRRVTAAVAIPRKLDQPGPFGWLLGQAQAGYIASTVPVSPDGTKLYISGGDGITVLRVPDLKPIATLAPGMDLGEVWISGDGRTVYATDQGKHVYVVPESGGAPIAVDLPESSGYFIASEHG